MKSPLVYILAIGLILAGIPSPSQAVTADKAYQKGSALYKNGQWKQSIEQFEEAVQLNPNHWQAFQGLGYAYLKDGNSRSAVNACQISLKINPNNPALQEFMKTQLNTLDHLSKKPSDDSVAIATAVLAGTAVVALLVALVKSINFGGGSC